MKCIVALAVLVSGLAIAGDDGFEPSQTARYRVTFEADWSVSTHPTDFPANPHFSGLIGATHNAETVIWRSGELASDGIERMAETGGKSILITEINPLIEAGAAGTLLSGGGIGRSPGSVGLNFEIARDHPLVSLVSMIAPSPDWFVGVDSLNLRQDGRWLERLVIELQPYDSGTDDGVTFVSPDSDASPQQPISRITQPPLDNGVALGRFVFELLETQGNLPLAGSQSGLYHDPERPGEGIQVLVSSVGERKFVFISWLTYHDGRPVWLVGNTDFQPGDDSIEINLSSTAGTGFGGLYNPADVEFIPWGSILLSFPSCGHLVAEYTADDAAFGSGIVLLEQLVDVAGSRCE